MRRARSLIALALAMTLGPVAPSRAQPGVDPANVGSTDADAGDGAAGDGETSELASDAAEDPTVAEARALFERGAGLADEQRFAEAAEAFARSLELVDRPSTAFNLALCHYALGRHVEAIAVLERYLDTADPEEEGESIADARRMIAHARRSVGEIALEVSPADARVSVDGHALPGGPTRTISVNAGTHVVRAEAPHHAPVLLEVEVRRGAVVRRAVQLESTRSPPRLAVTVPGLPDALIRIDGREVGRGGASLELEPGAHRVAIVHPELEPLEQTVELDWSEHAALTIGAARELPGPSLAEEPLFWVGVGAAILAVGAAVAIGVAVAESMNPSGGNTGVVLSPSGGWAPRLNP